MRRLSTIGYEGATLQDFIATLKAARISTLVDVRELPLSRRKGFSKSQLSANLKLADIEYVHFRELGDPKEGRDAARKGRFAEFRKIYGRHIKTAAAREALKDLLAVVESCSVCLLCYERDPAQCHRSIVSSEIANMREISVVHLGVRAGAAENGVSKVRNRAGSGAGQSAAAA